MIFNKLEVFSINTKAISVFFLSGVLLTMEFFPVLEGALKANRGDENRE
jgi:hypothetical protein